MANAKQLTVQNATVTTATIEVKTLAIGARQVTQGIFKQLIREPLIAYDGSLNGVPWGHVTWHPGCSDLPDHWHIVWQRGEELRRANVDKKPNFPALECAEADDFLNISISGSAHGHYTTRPIKRDRTGIFPEDRYLNDRHSRDADVDAFAKVSAAAMRVATQHEKVVNAELKALRPVEYYDVTHCGEIASLEETCDVVRKAIQAGYVIKPNVDMTEIDITPPGGDDSLTDTLTEAQGEILEALRIRREHSIKNLAEEREALSDPLRALDAELGVGPETWAERWSAVSSAYKAAVLAEAARRQRHRDVRTTLAQLPQLFIGG